MDLLDFEAFELYFDQSEDSAVMALIRQAASAYSDGDPEAPLMRAYALAPHSLNVLIALYRFYYYRQRLQDALHIAGEVLEVVREALEFPGDWRDLTALRIAAVAADAKVQLRFYLFTLKAEGVLRMRLGQLASSREIFAKLTELDPFDRIGTAGLLELVEQRQLCQEQL